jgi:hypothetical protein
MGLEQKQIVVVKIIRKPHFTSAHTSRRPIMQLLQAGVEIRFSCLR